MKTFEGLSVQTKRSKRKTVSLQVLKEQNDHIVLFVKMPEYIDHEQLQTILEAKRSWILKAKETVLVRETTKAQWLSDYSIKQNGKLPFKGKKISLNFLLKVSNPNISVKGNDDEITVITHPYFRTYHSDLSLMLKDYYYKMAYKEFSGIISNYSKKYGFKVNQLRIKDTKTRWGSCSAKMNVNLNWKLIIAPHRVYEYVIVHELCHLGCWNHSQQFWNRVAAILPDYKDRKDELKQISAFLSAFDFSKLEMEL
jgi:hypothetical protein